MNTKVIKVYECYGRDSQEAEMGLTRELAIAKATVRFGEYDLVAPSKVSLSQTEISELFMESIAILQSDFARYLTPDTDFGKDDVINSALNILDNKSFLSAQDALSKPFK